jgi:hypothetical protein
VSSSSQNLLLNILLDYTRVDFIKWLVDLSLISQSPGTAFWNFAGPLDFEAHEVSSWRNQQWKALRRLA